MDNFNFDTQDNSSEQPIRELIDKVQYDTFCQAYDCINEIGAEFLVAKGSKNPQKILQGLIHYFQHPDREEYEKCAVLLKVLRSYERENKSKNKMKKTVN